MRQRIITLRRRLAPSKHSSLRYCQITGLESWNEYRNVPMIPDRPLTLLPEVDDVSKLRYNGQRSPPYKPIFAPFPIVSCLVLSLKRPQGNVLLRPAS